MFKFHLVGGEWVDFNDPDSLVSFKYVIFANTMREAEEKFHVIFPNCVLMQCSM